MSWVRFIRPQVFDGIMFLESLGHSTNAQDVLSGAFHVLKPNGFIYIKDFFRRTACDTGGEQELDSVIDRLNSAYCYNVVTVQSLTDLLKATGFAVERVERINLNASRTHIEGFHELFGSTADDGPVTWFEIHCIKR